ncbi:blue light receptor [Aspergillus hancockii]|nr:blue light receptor [Aspergillus hancockii]
MDWVATEHESGVMQNQRRMQSEGHDLFGRESRRLPPPSLPAGKTGAQNSPDTADEQGWPQRVLSEMKDMLLLLNSDGKVLYASPSCKSITGYDASQLQQNALDRFIHSDDKAIFVEEMNECITTTSPVSCYFRFCMRDNGASCILEAYGHPHMKTTNLSDSPGNKIQDCIGIFLLCRPYPTKSSKLIDSFLEHKLENARLNQRIAELIQEEEEDLAAANDYPGTLTSRHDSAPSVRSNSNQSTMADAPGSGEENESSDALANDDPDSRGYLGIATDERAEVEDMSHIEGIEMMTGLHYGEGERSQGLSTGLRQGRLIHYDMESAKIDQQTRIIQDSERKKRQKGEYMCTDCGTSDSPEWRKGPEGPKTLCNACGLRWAKKEKKRQDHI